MTAPERLVTRIVGGRARGRRISVPDTGTRPTSDRAREAVFSSLEALRGSFDGTQVLDLYAGSGALGLEALSRGAAQVDLVESDRRATRVIEANRSVVGGGPDPSSLVGGTAQVHPITVERWLARSQVGSAFRYSARLRHRLLRPALRGRGRRSERSGGDTASAPSARGRSRAGHRASSQGPHLGLARGVRRHPRPCLWRSPPVDRWSRWRRRVQ